MPKPFFSIVVVSEQGEKYEQIYNSLDLSLYCKNFERKRIERIENLKREIKQNEKMRSNVQLRKKINRQKRGAKKLKKGLSTKITLPNSRLVDIPFEVVVVGKTPPIKSLPSGIRHIYFNGSLSQCLNEGVKGSYADYILIVNDNMGYSELFLDTLYMFVSRILPYMKEVLIIPRYSVDGVFQDENFSPIIGKSCLFEKDMWIKLGGVDDGGIEKLQVKFYKQGYTPFIATVSVIEERTNG